MNKKLEKCIEFNKIIELKDLLKNKKIDPSVQGNWAIRVASLHGYNEIIEMLMEDERVDPTVYDNYAILKAHSYSHDDCVNLLWTDNRVKQHLKIQEPELYNTLLVRNVKNKIKDF